MRLNLFKIVLLIAAFAAHGAVASDAPQRGGDVVFSLGLGTGWGRTTDNVLRFYDDYARIPRLHPRESGGAVQVSAGYRWSDDLVAGLDVLLWSRGADDDLATAHRDLLTAVAAVSWYPWRQGLFLRLGYGLGAARLDYLERGWEKRTQDTGTCYLLAGGYEIRLSDAWSVSPQVTHAGFATGDLQVWASLTCLTLALNFEP